MAKRIPKRYTPDWYQYRICIDTVKNPLKGYFLGGPTQEEAIDIIKSKFGFTNKDIKKLTGE